MTLNHRAVSVFLVDCTSTCWGTSNGWNHCRPSLKCFSANGAWSPGSVISWEGWPGRDEHSQRQEPNRQKVPT